MLQWTRDGFGLGVERNLTGFDRYHMSGYDEEGKKITHTVIFLKVRFFRIYREILCNFVSRKILKTLMKTLLELKRFISLKVYFFNVESKYLKDFPIYKNYKVFPFNLPIIIYSVQKSFLLE